MTSELAGFLRANELGWDPRYSHSPGYVEMSPELGRAVMATLAFACAEDEGLTLVTEFPDTFGRVIHQTKESVFDVCLKADSRWQEQSGDRMFELLVYQRCDPTKLTPERIQALNLESEARASFKKELEEAARSLPRVMVDRDRRDERLHDTINDIFRKWEKDRANLSNYVRALFGEGVLEQPEKLIEKIAETALGDPAKGAIVGGLTTSSLIGASAGFAVGLAIHTARSFFQTRKTEKESPFRYLTLLQKDGVGFVISK
ncbi:hypothetical protein [Mesorhizobium sp. B4-1-1]|uniref:hypothetical protein n=1 Tax=Mesorhizobium sp. B4-1-1 TaxID=2589890 RepID=UPI00112EEE0E|nr:hypothetical protein [Mesorhizobium sp. B4-1-1]TPI18882.1 hypothetical protein FJW10_17345 [Mesorhizobium sp. B4-1-1]